MQFDDYDQKVGYGETGRVKLYTLTDEFFVPGFMERDEGEREAPFETYPWDGVSDASIPRTCQRHHCRVY